MFTSLFLQQNLVISHVSVAAQRHMGAKTNRSPWQKSTGRQINLDPLSLAYLFLAKLKLSEEVVYLAAKNLIHCQTIVIPV